MTAGRSRQEFEADVEELTELARSAGVSLVDVITQQRAPATAKNMPATHTAMRRITGYPQSGSSLKNVEPT